MYVPNRLQLLLIAGLSLAGCLILFRSDLRLLYQDDPPKERTGELSFHDLQAHAGEQVITCEGFIKQGQGLQLIPGTSGKIIFSFDKDIVQPGSAAPGLVLW